MGKSQADAAASRIISLLSADPEKGAFVVQIPAGYRIEPEEVWVEATGQWVHLEDMTIKGDYTQDRLYPGLITRWVMRRFFRWWREQVPVPPACEHRNQTAVHWSQDGHVSLCRTCNRTVYHDK